MEVQVNDVWHSAAYGNSLHVLSSEVLCKRHFQADNNITLTFQCEITWTVITVVAKIPF